MTSSASLYRRAGSTLTEVLVVLCILVVLAALSFPIYQSTRAASARTQCVSNLRNIYAATMAFVEDNNGKLPPTLGPATVVDPTFNFGQYWWSQSYLGRYAVGPLDRRRDSGGMFTQKEVEIFNCPNRFLDGPDTPQSNGNPSISYMMVTFYPKDPAQVSPSRYLFRTMENKSQKMFITEGRGMSLYQVNTVTQPFGKTPTGLRRYHQNALNILFLDGHVETFSGPDQDMVAMHP